MHYQRALKEIVTALERNLQLLDARCRVDPTIDLGAIARRRRRALSNLRAALRQRDIPISPAPSNNPSASPVPTLSDLRQDESQLLGLYDAGLELTGGDAAQAALLTGQRAESEQAYLTLAAALRNGR